MCLHVPDTAKYCTLVHKIVTIINKSLHFGVVGYVGRSRSTTVSTGCVDFTQHLQFIGKVSKKGSKSILWFHTCTI